MLGVHDHGLERIELCRLEPQGTDARTQRVGRPGAETASAGKRQACLLYTSSANSINWGRLMPQIVYYVSAYAELVLAGKVLSLIHIFVTQSRRGRILIFY